MSGVTVRDITRDDIQNGFLEALDALRPASHMEHDTCREIYDEIKDDPNRVVAVAVLDGYIVGTASLVIERKFIHDGARAAHIEDVAVNTKFQRQNIGNKVVRYLLDVARQKGCYRTTLDCNDNLVGFYTGIGFRRNGVSMRVDHGQNRTE